MKTNIDLQNKTIFVTGVAGFIGANLVMKLFQKISNIHVVGIDNVNDYYDISIKEDRLCQIEKRVKKCAESTWTFIKGDIANKDFEKDQLIEV